VVADLSPLWGLFLSRFLPTACTVGCILTPLRGWGAHFVPRTLRLLLRSGVAAWAENDGHRVAGTRNRIRLIGSLAPLCTSASAAQMVLTLAPMLEKSPSQAKERLEWATRPALLSLLVSCVSPQCKPWVPF
jgi:hypothetical protein